MKCPCCGHEMVMDGHRKIDLMMCYDCGYIEGRRLELPQRHTNFERLSKLNLNEMAAFLADGLQIDEKALASWMEQAVA